MAHSKKPLLVMHTQHAARAGKWWNAVNSKQLECTCIHEALAASTIPGMALTHSS